MATDLGLSPTATHGGFSLALVVMGLSSPLIGGYIDRHGGRPVMVAGSCVSALGCVGLSMAHGIVAYYAAWALVGLAMRMTLYEAAFAALVRIAGPDAKQPISQITLLGGLASTAFWPVGHALAGALGWRGACLAYAAIALTTLPLHLGIPTNRYERCAHPSRVDRTPLAVTCRERILATSSYALVATLTMSLNTAFSAT